MIASIGLLFVPKSFEIELEEFIGKNKLFPVMPNKALNESKEMVESLNQVSDTIQKMATTYKNSEPATFKENKQIFIIELLNNLEPYKENMLYHDIADVDGKIINLIFEHLLENQEIDREKLLEIFAKCNSYIVGFDDEDISKKLEDNISQIVRTINVSYKVAKSKFILKKQEDENKKTMEKQLNGVSQAIKKMATGIEQTIQNENKYEKEKQKIAELLKQKGITVEEISIRKQGRYIIEIYVNEILETAKIEVIEKILTKLFKEQIVLNENSTVGNKLNFISEDKYIMAIGEEQATKSKSEQSGDCMLKIRLKDGKYLVAISDGMGSGTEARKSSQTALKMLEDLLQSGFDKNISLDLINTTLLNKNTETFATLDIAIVDLYEGQIEFIKSGACPTYIKNNSKVQIIKSNTLPTGMLENGDIQTFDKDIENGDILVMCSDGILDANIEYKNKELWIKYMLEDIETNNTSKIANILLNEAIDNNFGNIKDDMSIVVCKFKTRV